MGNMTIVCVLNDGLNEIEKNPEQFVENIKMGTMGEHKNYQDFSKNINYYPVGCMNNPMSVAKSFHANQSKIFFAGQNCMTEISNNYPCSKKEAEFQLERILKAKSMLEEAEKSIIKILENSK